MEFDSLVEVVLLSITLLLLFLWKQKRSREAAENVFHEEDGQPLSPKVPASPSTEQLVNGHASITVLALHSACKQFTNGAKSLELKLDCSSPDLSALSNFPVLSSVALRSLFPLGVGTFSSVLACPHLTSLDLTACRTVVDANNSVAGLCSVLDPNDLQSQDIFSLCRNSSTLQVLQLPDVCALRLGTVVHCFPKAGVAVMALTRSLHVGDVVQLQRVAHDVKGSDLHVWMSAKSVVTSIRTDDHRQLTCATPDETTGNPVDSQFAVSLKETGKKNDAVLWLGFDKTNTSA